MSRFKWVVASRLIAMAGSLAASGAWAIDIVTVKGEEGEQTVEGRIELEASDGGLMLMGRDGRLWALQPGMILSHQSDDKEFAPLDREMLAKNLLAELPAGFKIRHTDHYVIAHNTTTAYAVWCGTLYERLYSGFHRFFKDRDWPLSESSFPLIVVLFEDRQGYNAYGKKEVGEAISSVVGYYSLETNRVTTYDLTGLEQIRQPGARPSTTVLINQVLSLPAAESNVATMIHEAAHQLAYNLGVQSRSGFNPLWASEGLAIFFETPDLRNSRGWGKIGLVHYPRLHRFRQALAQGKALPLVAILESDDPLREPRTALDAYAQSWALSYYLLKKRPQEAIAYFRDLAEHPPLAPPTGAERQELFAKHFGDVAKFEKQFLDYIVRLK